MMKGWGEVDGLLGGGCLRGRWWRVMDLGRMKGFGGGGEGVECGGLGGWRTEMGVD